MAFLAPIAPALIGGALAAGGSILASRSAPKPPAPPKIPDAPKPEDMMDVIDKVAGVQAINVNGADGKKRRVIERIPRTKQEQILYDEAGDLMKNALGNIQQLYQLDPNAVIDFAPFIQSVNHLNQKRGRDIARLAQIPDFNEFAQNFKNMQKTVIDDEFRTAKNAKQAELTRMGYGVDSTAWANAEAALDRQYAEAVAKNDVTSEINARELQNKDIQNRVLAYNLGEQGRTGELDAEQMILAANREQAGERETHRAKQIQEQAGLFQTGAGIRKEDINTALQNVAPQTAQNLFASQMQGHRTNMEGSILNYQNQLGAFDRKPLNFGEIAGYHAGKIGGEMINPNSSIGKYTMGFADWLTRGKNDGFSKGLVY